MLSAALLCISVLTVSAIDLPVTTVNGKDYYYYDVQPKETLFSLSQRLGISREQILEYNPGVEGGLKAYTRLYFPVEAGVRSITAGDQVTTSHKVAKGETLYGIAKKYGISIDRLIELNPSARDGVRNGDVLVILSEQKVASPALPTAGKPSKGGTHTIAAGETLYRIAVNNGITVEQLLAVNPDLDPYNYSEGMIINLPATSDVAVVTEVDASLRPVKSKPAQPAPGKPTRVDNVRNNAVEVSIDVLNPGGATEAPAQTSDNTPAPRQEKPAATPASNEASVNGKATSAPVSTPAALSVSQRNADKPFNIAMMLPFNLNESGNNKTAENFTDFYRGFLLGAKEMSKSGKQINIKAFDTRGDVNTVKELMQLEEMNDVDVFVAPASAAELDYIISHVDGDRQFVFNNFAVKSTKYQDNPNVMQANIPHQQMYQRAIDAFMTEMEGRTPIFVQRIGAPADKEEFTSMLKSQLTDKGITFKEITCEYSLKDDDLADLDLNESYVVVPVSSSATEFNKMVQALKRFKATLLSKGGLALFGYPEWLTFRGERMDNLGALNATIYSRFYLDEGYYPVRRVIAGYKEEYGRDMNTAVPSQAFMGYDAARFLIKSLRSNNGDFHINITPYDGLQSDFIFTDSDCDGLVNTSVELIKFREGGFTEHRNI